MKDRQILGNQARYYSNVTGLNLLALLFLWLIFSPIFVHKKADAVPLKVVSSSVINGQGVVKVISGTPTRLSIPSLNIDLPVDKGEFNQATSTWTLHDLRAYYAIYSPPPSNIGGNTFIYGHNNYQTLGAVKSATPGTLAYIYADNGHVFTYSFESYSFVDPNDLSVFSYKGKPILTIQTCTGVFNESRGMFKFNFVKAE